MPTKIGNVTSARYKKLVREGRDLVEQKTRCQFKLGDNALEIEPLRNHGGDNGRSGDEVFTVSESLHMYAEDIGVAYNTITNYRFVSAHWPAPQRKRGVSHKIHAILVSAREPFKLINDPPMDPRTGKRRWTPDLASRAVGRRPESPVTPQEKVERIHDLAHDEGVAATVATDFLRRPAVAYRAMRDDTARHMVNRAQVEQSQQAGQVARQRTPAVGNLQRNTEFWDLIGACAQFVSVAGRTLPALRGQHLSTDERDVVIKNIGRVRATADWIESAVETGDVTIDEGLEKLLRGE